MSSGRLPVVESDKSREEAAARAAERRENHKAGLGFQTDEELKASGVLHPTTAAIHASVEERFRRIAEHDLSQALKPREERTTLISANGDCPEELMEVPVSYKEAAYGGVSEVKSSGPVPGGTVFSMFIPWLEDWVTESKVKSEFVKLGWGWVSSVQLVRVDKGKRPHQKCYIHFETISSEGRDIVDHLSSEPMEMEGGRKVYAEVKVYYRPGTDYYWKVRRSTWKSRPRETPKVELVPFGK
jgi:hypothetical protein